MKYLLDTNICIYIIKRNPARVRERFYREDVGDVGISAITLCEMEFGAEKSANPAANRATLYEFAAPLQVMEFEPRAAPVYGRVRSALERAGKPIGPLDTLIAAHALFLDWTLVTRNVKEFSRVAGLRIENWADPSR